MKVLSTILLLLASVVSVTAQQQKFTFPTDGSTVKAGEKTTIKWDATNTAVSKVTLQLCLFGGSVSCSSIAGDVSNSGSYDWTPGSDLSSSGYFLLMLNGAEQLATSGSFSVSGGSGSSSSSGGSSSSGTSGSSGSSESSGSGTTNSATGTSDGTGPVTVTVTNTNGQASTYVANVSSTPGSSNSGSSGVSAGTLGGAIGGTLGGLALLGIGGFLLFRHRKNKKAAAANELDEKDLEAGAAGGKKSKEEKRSSKRKSGLLNKKGVSIPDPDAGVVEAADNPVYEMSAVQDPVEAPDHRFYAMELDSREVLPQERDAKLAAATADKEKNLRAGDKQSPAINLSPPPAQDGTGKTADSYRYNLARDVNSDQKSEHQYQAYRPPSTDGAADATTSTKPSTAANDTETDTKVTDVKPADATTIDATTTDASTTDATTTDATKPEAKEATAGETATSVKQSESTEIKSDEPKKADS